MSDSMSPAIVLMIGVRAVPLGLGISHLVANHRVPVVVDLLKM
jgi:hypothetical protein